MTHRPADPVLATALRAVEAGQPALLVTIATTKGSTPRVPGTRMLVEEADIAGSVGGGRLEFEIIAHARDLLARGAAATSREHFILGPDLRQCCGGALDIILEPLSARSANWLRQAIAWEEADSVWHSELDIGAPSHARRIGLAEDASPLLGATLVKAGETTRLVEICGGQWALLYLFGAGHVGRAIVELMGALPYHVVWSDSRPDAFPATVPGNVITDTGDAALDMIKNAPADAHFLVMTHSHALDYDLVAAILARGDFASLGLIGSATKRARFIQRLREDGVGDRTLARLQCPVGLAGIKSKVPAAIAIAVVADLLVQSEAATAARDVAPGVQLRA